MANRISSTVLMEQKYRLPYQWSEDSFSRFQIIYRSYVQQALGLLPPPSAHILDAGCGDGRVAGLLVEHGYTVTGIDVSERAIGYARLLVPEAKCCVADLGAPGWEELGLEQLDGTCLIEVLEHMDDAGRHASLKNIWRLLKPQGSVIITVPSSLLDPRPDHVGHFELEQLDELIKTCGFVRKKLLSHLDLKSFSGKLMLSNRLWKVISNQYWNLKVARALMGYLFRRSGPFAKAADRAERYILQAVKIPESHEN